MIKRKEHEIEDIEAKFRRENDDDDDDDDMIKKYKIDSLNSKIVNELNFQFDMIKTAMIASFVVGGLSVLGTMSILKRIRITTS